VARLHERFTIVVQGFSNDGFDEFAAPRLLEDALVDTAARVEVLRETVKVTRFQLPPEALPESTADAPEVTMKRLKASAISAPRWERRVAAALWVVAAVIVATLWFAQT
jgi:hypothetical protein